MAKRGAGLGETGGGVHDDQSSSRVLYAVCTSQRPTCCLGDAKGTEGAAKSGAVHEKRLDASFATPAPPPFGDHSLSKARITVMNGSNDAKPRGQGQG